VPLAAVAAPAVTVESTAALEVRIRRLEEELLRLRQGIPPPVAPAPPADPPPQPPSPVQREKPVSGRTPHSSLLLSIGRKMMAAASAPSGPAPSPETETRSSAAAGGYSQHWLLFDIIAEARAIVRMFVDPRYRLSWSGRVGSLVLIVLIATSWIWLPFSDKIPFLNKIVDLLLAFVLFKVLGHEARRYRETAPDLPPSLRL
jgi:hypothetical protein